MWVSKVICGWATRCRNTACCNSSWAHSRRITGVGHAREGREFVDHAPDVADLADDRVGALLEHFAVGADLAAVFALEPFGGKLDGGQRVLDLVGDAPRDVGPGGGALGRNKVGDVVEGGDVAAAVTDRARR